MKNLNSSFLVCFIICLVIYFTIPVLGISQVKLDVTNFKSYFLRNLQCPEQFTYDTSSNLCTLLKAHLLSNFDRSDDTSHKLPKAVRDKIQKDWDKIDSIVFEFSDNAPSWLKEEGNRFLYKRSAKEIFDYLKKNKKTSLIFPVFITYPSKQEDVYKSWQISPAMYLFQSEPLSGDLRWMIALEAYFHGPIYEKK